MICRHLMPARATQENPSLYFLKITTYLKKTKKTEISFATVDRCEIYIFHNLVKLFKHAFVC